MAEEKKSSAGTWVLGGIGLFTVLCLLSNALGRRAATVAPAPSQAEVWAAEAKKSEDERERAEKKNADRAAAAQALREFLATVKKSGSWERFFSDARPLDASPELLQVMATLEFERQPKRDRVAAAKAMLVLWEQESRKVRPDMRYPPRIQLLDIRGREIGGSTWTGDVEVKGD